MAAIQLHSDCPDAMTSVSNDFIDHYMPEANGEFVKVYAVKKEGAELSDAEFRKFLKLHLDNYKRPRDFEFVEALPKNALRKVLKRELRKDAVEKLKKAVAAGAATPSED